MRRYAKTGNAAYGVSWVIRARPPAQFRWRSLQICIVEAGGKVVREGKALSESVAYTKSL